MLHSHELLGSSKCKNQAHGLLSLLPAVSNGFTIAPLIGLVMIESLSGVTDKYTLGMQPITGYDCHHQLPQVYTKSYGRSA